jgi:HrpA-like RNA helicase
MLLLLLCPPADAAREKFFVPESDHLTLLHVYQQWKNNGYRGDWCARHYLQGKGLKKAKEVGLVLLVCSTDRIHTDFAAMTACVCLPDLLHGERCR